MNMFREWVHKIKSFSLWAGMKNFWLRVRYSGHSLKMRMSAFWSFTDRSLWYILSALGLVIVVMGLLISNAVDAVDDQAVNRQLTCLARNVYYEARGEPDKGKRAVAKVTLNRVKSSRFPNTICEAVYEQRWDKRRRRYVGAFAWTEFDSVPSPKSRQWRKAWKAAEAVYQNPESVQLKGALFYHATRIKPRWAKQKKRIKKIGRHIFYR